MVVVDIVEKELPRHMSDQPTYEQVLELPATSEQRVPVEFLDENDHMNISHYFQMCARAMGDFCTTVGIGDDYPTRRGSMVFTAEQHLRYLAEVRVDEDLSVHVRPIERSAKALLAMAFLANRTTRRVACTFEASLVHVDMQTRRPSDLPDDIARTIDAVLTENVFDWAAPVCGVMGVRTRQSGTHPF